MNWDVYAYGNGDAIRIIFNGVASIFGNGDFVQALSISALIAFIALLIRSVFDKNLLQNFQYIMIIFFMYLTLFVPTTNVVVRDRVKTSDVFVVQNIPLGMAVSVGLFSTVGDWLARTYETVFSLPGGLSYQGNGIMFAQKLIDVASEKYTIPNTYTMQSFQAFWKNCVVLDGIGNNRLTPDGIKEARDLGQYLRDRVAVNVAYFRYVSPAGVESLQPCRSGFISIESDIAAQTSEARQYAGASLVNYTGTMASAEIALSNNSATLGALAQIPDPSSLIEKQAILNKAVCSATAAARTLGVGDKSDFIVDKVHCESNKEGQAYQKFGMERLPMMMGLLAGFIYALFPIIALMAFISPAKVLMGYVKALAWVGLWPLMFAIINFFMMYYARQYTLAGNTLTLGYSIEAQANYTQYVQQQWNLAATMVLSVPLISYMLISQSGAMMASTVGRMLGGADEAINRSSNQLTDGHTALSGTGFDANRNGGYNQSYSTGDGGQTMETAGGREFITQASSKWAATSKDMESVVERSGDELSHATKNVENTQAALSDNNRELLNDLTAVNSQLSSSGVTGYDSSTVDSTAITKNTQEGIQQLMGYSEKNNLNWSEQDAARIYAKASAGVDLGFANAEAGVEGSVVNSRNETLSTEENKALNSTSAYSELLSMKSDSAYRTAVSHNLSDQNGSLESLQANTLESNELSQQHSVAVSEEESWKDTHSLNKDIASSLSIENMDAIRLSVMNNGVTASEFTNVMNGVRDNTDSVVSGRVVDSREQLMEWVRQSPDSNFNKDFGAGVGSDVLNNGRAGVDRVVEEAHNKMDDFNNRSQGIIDSNRVVTQENYNNQLAENEQTISTNFHSPDGNTKDGSSVQVRMNEAKGSFDHKENVAQEFVEEAQNVSIIDRAALKTDERERPILGDHRSNYVTDEGMEEDEQLKDRNLFGKNPK